MCENQDILVTQADFDCVGLVAKHCDPKKLCIATDEAQLWDLSELFCNFWDYIVSANTSVNDYDEKYALYLIELAACESNPECTTPPAAPVKPLTYDIDKAILCGGEYIGCSGKTKRHLGVKRILVYYAYSRYLLINEFNDTASGNVTKTNDFSIPKNIKDIQSFADKYRTMGYNAFKQTQSFLCANKAVLSDFDSCDCAPCDCGGKCKGETKAKGFGIRSSIIEKHTGYERL